MITFLKNIKALKPLEAIAKVDVILLVFIVFYFILHVLFGHGFSKLAFAPNIYVNDIMVGVISLFALYRTRHHLHDKWILGLFALAILWFIASIFIKDQIVLVFRQFALIYYMICGYLITRFIFSLKEGVQVMKILLFGVASITFIIQFIYLSRILILGEMNWSKDKFYFSPMIIPGLLVFGSVVLNQLKKWYAWILFPITLVLIRSANHDSSDLAIILVIAMYFWLKLNRQFKWISIFIIGTALISLILLYPNFSNNTSMWRLEYWHFVWENAWDNYHFLIGNGFGINYLSIEQFEHLEQIISVRYNNETMEEIIKRVPPHNSFISFFIHLGMIGFGLLFYKFFITTKNALTTTTKDGNLFLQLFLGMVVWCSFNVILELPHSSIYIWLVIFSFVFYHTKWMQKLTTYSTPHD